MNTLNLANLPAGTSIEFIQWIIDSKIGNWSELMVFIASHHDWHKKKLIPFECTDEEASFIILRWT